MLSQTLASHFACRAWRGLLAAGAAALLVACQTAPTDTPAAGNAATARTAPAARTVAATAPAAVPITISAAVDASNPDQPEAPIVGSHTDAHGCKPSTGHAWCTRTNRCERPWELALQRGFANTPAGWHAYCDGTTK